MGIEYIVLHKTATKDSVIEIAKFNPNFCTQFHYVGSKPTKSRYQSFIN